jgi:hypothetical protein
MREMTALPRLRFAAACAVLAVLSACGHDSAEAKAAAPLSELQTKAVVPDAKAMPGWKVTSPPDAYSMEKARSTEPDLCPKVLRKGCEGVRFVGSSEFSGTKKPLVAFTALAYRNEATAEAAYEVFWNSYRKSLAKPKKLDVGNLGDRHDAIFGVGGYEGEETALAQIRVGTVLISLTTGVGQSTRLDHTLVKELAAALTDRAREAQVGKTPSAGIDAG